MKRAKKWQVVVLAVATLLYGSDVVFAKNVKLEKIVVTPSRYEASDSDVSKSVTVIDSDAIAASNAQSVPDLIKGETGVEIKDILSNGKTAIVDIRGFGESAPLNTLVLIDGRRTNQIDLSGADWSQININSIERIEIVRGPQSVLYGDNAVGGVVNIITKSGAGKKPTIGIGYKGGSYRYQEFDASIEGGSAFLDYYSDFNQSSTNGYRVNNDLELIDATASITAKPAQHLKVRVEGGYHKDWYGQPGALSPALLNTLGRTGSNAPYDRAKTEDYYVMATPETYHSSDNGKVTFSGDCVVRVRRAESFFNSATGSTQRTDHIKTFGLTPKISIENDLLKMANTFMMGLDYYSNRDAITSTSGAARAVTVIEKNTLGFYATDSISLTPSLTVNAGGRVERAYFDFLQGEINQNETKRRPTEVAIEAGLNYEYAERSSIYANYSRSYRFPVVDEWFSSDYVFAGTLIPGTGLNADLVPQTGNHFEIGVREGLLKYFGINADYFFQYLKHELYYNPATFMNSVYDATIRTGMELEAHLRPLDELDMTAKYTFEKAFFNGGQFNGNEIPGVPRDKITCGVDYTYRDCLRLHYMANVIGPQRFISDQTNTNPKLKLYTTHDLKLSYYKYGFSAYIAIYNILDNKYSSYGAIWGGVPYYFTSPGRNVTIGAEYKF